MTNEIELVGTDHPFGIYSQLLVFRNEAFNDQKPNYLQYNSNGLCAVIEHRFQCTI